MCSGDCQNPGQWKTGPDGRASWDSLMQLGIEDANSLRECQAKLRACQACLERGRNAGVIH